MQSRRVLATAMALHATAASTAVLAQSPAPPRQTTIDIPFQRFVLPNGLTLIVHEDRKAPIVVLTSSSDPRQLAQCYQLGANSCVQKPVRHEEFRAAVQSIARYWLGLNQAPPSSAAPVT